MNTPSTRAESKPDVPVPPDPVDPAPGDTESEIVPVIAPRENGEHGDVDDPNEVRDPPARPRNPS